MLNLSEGNQNYDLNDKFHQNFNEMERFKNMQKL